MAAKKTAFILSIQEQDIEFVKKLAAELSFDFIAVKTWDDLIQHPQTLGDGVFFFDADNPEIMNASKTIVSMLPEQRVFALSNNLTYIQASEAKNHAQRELLTQQNFLRRYDAAGFHVYRELVRLATLMPADGFATFFSSSTKIQKISLRKSAERKPAVDATESFLNKRGLENRIANRVAQAVDELLMNAIFDAACDLEGKPTRQLLDRKALFDFLRSELVDLRIASNEHYIGLCVTDTFGSLKKETAFHFLAKDYSNTDYKPRRYGPGAGLGLYGIIQSNVSLVMYCRPRQSTEAMIFIPQVNSYKAFKTGFQMAGFLIKHEK